jgi:hypothetical protein
MEASLAQLVMLVNGLPSIAYLTLCLVMGSSFCSPDLDILDSPCAPFIVWRFVHPLS